jgi:hypothetical protein
MGFFAHLYVVEMTAGADTAEAVTTIYSGDIGQKAYFSWLRGDRADQLIPYAGSTIFADRELTILPGYPVRQTIAYAGGPGVRDQFYFDASFHPPNQQEPVLFHLLFPPHFVPMRQREPFRQPSEPAVDLQNNRLIATYAVTGPTTLSYWVGNRNERDELSTYDVSTLFAPVAKEPWKMEFELNLWILKWKAKQ